MLRIVAYANGRIPASALASIPGGQLEKTAAAAWNAMRAEIIRRGGPAIRPLGGVSSYRPYAAQLYFWNLWRSGRGNVAARPGTSNHGWGRAVDVATPAMAQWIIRVGSKYGWNHAEGARVGEWWHMGYVGGFHGKVTPSDPTIRKGTINRAAVTRLQKLLRGLNLTRVVNGKYGLWTRRAVRKFQSKHGLPVDGVVGPKTWAALRKASG